MAKLPDETSIGRVPAPSQTPGISVARIDYSPMAEGGKAIATGLQAVSSMAARYAEKQGEADDFRTQEALVNWKLDREKEFEDAQRNMPVGGGDFAASWDKNYSASAREFMKNVPAQLRPKYDLALVEYNARLSKAAGTAQNNAADTYEKDRLETTLGRLTGAAEGDADRGAEFADEGFKLIDGSRLSPAVKASARQAFEDRIVGSRYQGLVKAGRTDEAFALAREHDARRPQVGVASVNAKERVASIVNRPELAGAIRSAAAELGIPAEDLATVISYETGGKFSTSIRGGAGNRHIGLIQFGEEEQRKYGASQSQSATEQMKAVVAYLKDRGLKPGMGILDLYSTINAGSPGRYNASDANNGGAPGSVRDKVEKQMGGHRDLAYALLGEGPPAQAGPPMPPQRPAFATDGSPAADGTTAPLVSATPATTAPKPAMGPTEMKAREFAEKYGKQQAAAVGETYERQFIDALAGKGPIPSRETIERDARLTEPVRNSLLQRHGATLRADAGNVGRAIADDLASIEAKGAPLAGLDRARVAGALGEEQATAWEGERVRAQKIHTALNGIETLSEGAVEQRLQSLEPKAGEAGYVDDMRAYDKARKRADRFLEARRSDPALSVDTFPAVREARAAAKYQGSDESRSIEPESAQAIVRSRIAAQRQLDINEPMAVTRSEARTIARQLRFIGDDDAKGMERFMRQLRGTYGDLADEVLTSTLQLENVNRDLAVLATDVVNKVSIGQSPSMGIARQFEIAAENQNIDTAMSGKAAAPQRTAPTTGDRLNTYQQGLERQDALRRNAGNKKPGQAEEATFDAEDIRWLDKNRTNPDAAMNFDLKYGPKAAARILTDLDRRKGAR